MHALRNAIIGALITANLLAANAQTTWHVDMANSSGLCDGTAWETAFPQLYTALDISSNGDVILVAQGIYSADPTAWPSDNEAAFQMKNGVSIYGGYAGSTDPDPNSRNITAFPSILDGQGRYHVFYHPDGLNLDNSAILDGFTITNGDATAGGQPHSRGGGIHNYNCSPAIQNCTFHNNTAKGGGAAYNKYGAPLFINCSFTHNTLTSAIGAEKYGGAIQNDNSNAVIRNCYFAGNHAAQFGGAIANELGSPHIINSAFVANYAEAGGAIANVECNSVITNCTIAANCAGEEGGGIDNYESSPTITNCIVYANNAPSKPQINSTYASYPTITYSCVQDGPLTNHNINTDPLFIANPDVGTNGCGDGDDSYGDLRLSYGSPCIDAADNTALPANISTDLFGSIRRLDDPATPDTGNGTPPIVDMGAYEFVTDDCNQNETPDDQDIAEGTSQDCNHTNIPDECEPGGTEDCNQNGQSDLCDIYTWLSEDCNFNYVPDECDIAGDTSEDCNGNSIPDDCDIADYTSYDCNNNDIPDECEIMPSTCIYVDVAATGLNNGTQWADAYTSLSDALALAACNESINYINVAQGTYLPDTTGLANPRNATFLIRDGVQIRGCYAGNTLPTPDFRDRIAYTTILSGDIGTPEVDADNCYHVVTADNTYQTTMIDGLTITGGNATNIQGGGIQAGYCSAIFAHCTIIHNTGAFGGGLFVSDGDPLFLRCRFIGNSAWRGGAATITYGQPRFINCLLSGNTATLAGGGAVYSVSTDAVFANCTFSGNAATGYYPIGASVLCEESELVVDNCIFWNNTPYGSGFYIDAPYMPSINYCCLEGGWPNGAGNISTPPLFIDADGPDNIVGTIDDNLRLSPGSSCIDAGNNPAINPHMVVTDLDFWGRFMDDPHTADTGYAGPTGPPIVDIGAYEYWNDCNNNDIPDTLDIDRETSTDYDENNIPDECELGDLDRDGDVDTDDWTIMSGCLTGPNTPYPQNCNLADLDTDNDVDIKDCANFQQLFTG